VREADHPLRPAGRWDGIAAALSRIIGLLYLSCRYSRLCTLIMAPLPTTWMCPPRPLPAR
jgi:hypothetical protein